MDLNKHIVKNNNNKPFHSNGFAQIAVGDRVGSTDNSSFEQRQQIDRQRRLVYGYNRSAIGSTYGVMRAKQVLNNSNRLATGPLSLQQHKVQPPVIDHQSNQQHFNEPLARNYNPFS
jgi:hypothetical protein